MLKAARKCSSDLGKAADKLEWRRRMRVALANPNRQRSRCKTAAGDNGSTKLGWAKLGWAKLGWGQRSLISVEEGRISSTKAKRLFCREESAEVGNPLHRDGLHHITTPTVKHLGIHDMRTRPRAVGSERLNDHSVLNSVSI